MKFTQMKIRYIHLLLLFIGIGCQTEYKKETIIEETKKANLEPRGRLVKKSTQAKENVTKALKVEPPSCDQHKEPYIPSYVKSHLEESFSQYRIARNSDFFDNYWCHFYKDEDSPYFIAVDWDGDKEDEFVTILTNDNRTKTLIVAIDEKHNHLSSIVADSVFREFTSQTKERYTKFGFGLRKEPADSLIRTTSNTTYSFPFDFPALEYFEKGSIFYYWTGETFVKINMGC